MSAPQAASGLRPLDVPRPIEVRADAGGLPVAVARSHAPQAPQRGGRPGRASVGGTWFAVTEVEEAWRVAEEWWRAEPVARTYFRVILEDGRSLTLFRDDSSPLALPGDAHAGDAAGAAWYEQRYAGGGGISGRNGVWNGARDAS